MSRTYKKNIKVGVAGGTNTEFYRSRDRKIRRKNREVCRGMVDDEDRDLTVSALVSGDQREQLAKIANELAEKDGVKEFDTVYDNAQTATSLTDGTTTKLLANMSGDEGIKNAYTALAASEKSYTEANTAAITAMAAVTAAQTKLTEITNKIGTNIKENPSQWDSKTMKAYNEEVTKLHTETVNSIGGNINNWSNDDIKKYQAAEADATTKVAY